MAIQGETRESTRIRIREPKQYKVIMHNDDFTTMDFVVDILKDIFHKDEMEAERLMLLVHEAGKAVVGPIHMTLPCPKCRRQRQGRKRKAFRFE